MVFAVRHVESQQMASLPLIDSVSMKRLRFRAGTMKAHLELVFIFQLPF